jgi:hypothetical protein
VFLADLTVELRAWPTDTWSKVGVDPQAAAGAVVAGWQRGDLLGLRLAGHDLRARPARRPPRPSARPGVPAVAAPLQRPPGRRPVPVAADIGRLRQGPRWTAPSGHPAAVPRRCRTPDTAQPSGRPQSDMAAACGGHCGRPRTCRGSSLPACREQCDPLGYAGQTRPLSAQGGGHQRPNRPALDAPSGHPGSPAEHLAQRPPAAQAGCRGHCGSVPAGQWTAGHVRRSHCWTPCPPGFGAAGCGSRRNRTLPPQFRCCRTADAPGPQSAALPKAAWRQVSSENLPRAAEPSRRNTAEGALARG